MNFCTLFDINHLSRGLLLYESLVQSSVNNFKFYVIAFDKETYQILLQLNLNQLIPVKLDDFENKELLSVKKSRTSAEYCWTSTPWAIKYSIEKFDLDHCIYVDADLYFYKDPSIILNELDFNDSVLITEHDYSKKYDQTEKSGKYCVQFMYFKNDKKGLNALNWWAKKCIEWCYNRHEDGKFGDQKYIEKFPILFDGVHILNKKNQALAPWNIQKHINNDFSDVPVFFHFHGVRYMEQNRFFLGYYRLNKNVLKKFYIEYLFRLKNSDFFINRKEVNFSRFEKLKINIKNLFANLIINVDSKNC
jgi:hypothetical protein